MTPNPSAVLLATSAIAGLTLTSIPAMGGIDVTANFVSGGPVTDTLLAVDTPRVDGTQGNVADVGHSIVVAATTGDQYLPEGWEPDGSPAESAGGTNVRWMSANSVATWTFDLPDGTVINSIYASFRGQGNTTGNHIYSYDEGAPVNLVKSHASAAAGDLVLNWADSLTVTHNQNFERLFTGPITVAGGDGFTVNLTAVTNFAWSDAIVVDYTIPANDADMDGMPDDWEDDNGLDKLVNDAGDHDDADLLTNLEEYMRGTDPQDPDSDDDGLQDHVEDDSGTWTSASDTGTDPNDSDTDDDGLYDGVENNTGTWVSAAQTGTDPHRADSDNDGLGDGAENPDLSFIENVRPGTDPNDPDSDNDTHSDGVEFFSDSDPTDISSTPPAVPSPRDIVINEIHYDPEDKTRRAEFIELYNRGIFPVNLTGWQFTDGVTFTFPGVTLPPGAYLVVAEDPATLLADFGVTGIGPWVGQLSNSGERVVLRDNLGAVADEVDYGVGFPWPTAAQGDGPSMELVHPSLDNDLAGSWRSAAVGGYTGPPTPGAANSNLSSAVPPQIRQVEHLPEVPQPGEAVTVTAKITDPGGVSSATLSYQLVDPGSYIRKSDAAFETAWTDVAMFDDGTNGDPVAGDDRYTAVLPGTMQTHRRLVRYRIEATDGLGAGGQVPYFDDPQPNFGYFCYGGVPAWAAAAEPGVTPVETFSSALLESIPVYHLVANGGDVTNCQFNSGFRNTRFLGTMVYDGKVYDHIEFNIRGEGSTYRTGKNKWHFRFHRGHEFEIRDNFGNKYDSPIRNIKVNGGTAPWTYVNRGMAGIDECITYRLFGLAGVPASRTSYFHLRVIDGAVEQNPADQYDGDLWGLYHSVEVPSGRFLDDRGLPDGNVYKLDAELQQDNQGADEPLGPSDFNAIRGAFNTGQNEAWWQANTDISTYGRYRGVAEAVTHYDQRDGRQGYYYHNPETDKWVMMPWDCDTMFQLTAKYYTWDRFRHCVSTSYPDNYRESLNQQREILDLLFNTKAVDTVMSEFIDIVNPAGQAQTLADMDLFAWDHNPRTPGQFKGSYNVLTGSSNPANASYSRTLISADHEGQMDYMRDFMQPGGWGYDKLVAEVADAQIPSTPTVTYTGTVGYPVNGLRFTSGAFSDPQGAGSFASMEWRVGEIYNPMTPGYVAGDAWIYEVTDLWNSGTLAPFVADTAIPTSTLRPGHTYRARVRHWDDTGRASHWSDPVEFVAGLPLVAPYQDSLVISEIMYNPAGGSGHEFVELHNVGATTVDLTDVRFTKGIDYDFPNGTTIAPGAWLLVVKNLAAFEAEYGSGLPVVGVWDVDDKLSNGGENLKLSLGAGTAIHEFVYDDAHPWPTAPDGSGFSLTLSCVESGVNHADPGVWRASADWGGSPGRDESISIDDWLTAYGLGAGDEFLDGDGDGLLSLLEYAIGTDPTIRDNSDTFFVSIVGGEAYYSYTRSRTADGVTVIAEYSSDLLNWSPAEIVATNDLGGGLDQVAVRRFGPGSGETQGFFRLRVELK